jgi:hypothetical protein
VSGFGGYDTEVLTTIHANLLAGLDRVAESITDGTFHVVGPKGSAPPSQSGHLTLALIDGISAELERRNHAESCDR